MHISTSGFQPNNYNSRSSGQSLKFIKDPLQSQGQREFEDYFQGISKSSKEEMEKQNYETSTQNMKNQQGKNFPNIEFDPKCLKVLPTNLNSTLISKQDSERTQDSKSYTLLTSALKSNFSETLNHDKLHNNISINNFPTSLIGIKRATTPLIHNSPDTPGHTLNLQNHAREKLQSNMNPFFQNRIQKKIEECELDKTPPFLNEDLEKDFSRNFERARQIHKSYTGSISSFKSGKESSPTLLKKPIRTILFDEKDSTNLYPPSEESVYRSGSLKMFSLGSKLSSSSKKQLLLDKDKVIETDRFSLKQDDRASNYKTNEPKTPYKNKSFKSTPSTIIKTEPSFANDRSLKKQTNYTGNIYSQPLFQRLLNFNFYKRTKCSCDSNLKQSETCSRAFSWIQKKYKKSEFDYLKLTYEKILSESKIQNQEYARQIQKDLNRTFPTNKFFGTGSEGINSLERVLNAFAKYDPKVGYVQGMNFIAASILYHAEEYLAFWLLVMIFEIFEMRDIYLPKLPGLSKHCQIIDLLIFHHQHPLYTHLCTNGIKVEMFCSEWIFALFASVIPVENMASFYDQLLEDAFLQQFDKILKESSDFSEIMTVLKSQNHITKQRNIEKNLFIIDWNVLFQKAQKIQIDSTFIYKMHTNFDLTNQWFRTSDVD